MTDAPPPDRPLLDSEGRPITPRYVELRSLVRGTYDLQRLRIMMGNRIVAQFKAKLGQRPGLSEEDELDEESVSVLADLRKDFDKLMDGVKQVKLATFKASPLISTFTEFVILQQYLEMEEMEKRHFLQMGKVLKEIPFYVQWLSEVQGVGPAMAGVILSEVDIRRAKYPSSLWQYAGLGVEADGAGTSRRKEHMHRIAYRNKDGEMAERNGIRFNPFLKTKLMGVLANSFVKQSAEKCPYRKVYDNYKHRLESHPKWAAESKGHRHEAAKRYAVKMFLIDLYKAWRAHDGYPVAPPYSEAKLGMRAHGEGQAG